MSLEVSRFKAAPALAAMLLACLPVAHAQGLPAECGEIANGYGPFDYRSNPDRRQMVEPFHFTPEVEALLRGKSGYLAGDIDYTLRAFPNHHRALVSMMRLAERYNATTAPQARYSVECYFKRGIAFQPKDLVVRMLYAGYLAKQKRKDDALGQLAFVRQNAEDNAFTHYNLGLSYEELGAYDEALEEAHKAMALGFPRTELKEKLIKANRWAEPASAPQ